MRKLLLIWESDLTHVYELDATSEAAELARQSAGLFINGDDIEEGHAIEHLNVWIGENSPTDIGVSAVLKGPYDEVVVCGFFA